MSTPTKELDDETVRSALEAERLTLCDRLSALAADDWSAPSLCDGWTVQDVAAHLALATRESGWRFVTGMIRHRGNFDAMTAENARRHARVNSPDEIVAQLRATAGSADTSLGSSLRDSLIDVIVHTQDIGRAIDRTWTHPPERVAIALDQAVASRWYGAKKRFADVTLRSTDASWVGGTGHSAVEGSIVDLLLAATGRSTGLDHLRGPGVALVRSRT